MLLDLNNKPYWIHINPNMGVGYGAGHSYAVTRSPVNPFTNRLYPN